MAMSGAERRNIKEFSAQETGELMISTREDE